MLIFPNNSANHIPKSEDYNGFYTCSDGYLHFDDFKEGVYMFSIYTVDYHFSCNSERIQYKSGPYYVKVKESDFLLFLETIKKAKKPNSIRSVAYALGLRLDDFGEERIPGTTAYKRERIRYGGPNLPRQWECYD